MDRKEGGCATGPGDESSNLELVPGAELPHDQTLIAEGWEWRANADERRSREMYDTYTELGFEVRLESVDASALCEACGGCKSAFEGFSAVYVRKKPSSA